MVQDSTTHRGSRIGRRGSMRLTPSRPVLVVAIGGLLASLLAACGSDSGSTNNPQPGSTALEKTTLEVGILKVAALTPVWYAGESGLFKEAGFDEVKVQIVASDVEGINLVTAGRMDFSISTYVNTAQAVSRNFKIVHVMGTDGLTALQTPNALGSRDGYAVVVKQGSPIQNLKQLEGKKVAVSAVPGLTWAFLNKAMKNAGADPAKTTFVPMPFTAMTDALNRDQVDAAGMLEPSTTRTLLAGGKAIAFPYFDVIGHPAGLGGLVAQTDYPTKNPNTLKAFVGAIQKAMDRLNADHDLAVTQVAAFSGLDASIVSSMVFPTWDTKVASADVQVQLDLALELGMLTEPVKVEEIVDPSTLKT